MTSEGRNGQSVPNKPPAVRLWLVVGVTCSAALLTWPAWLATQERDPLELSNADGKSRFYATAYREMEPPANVCLAQRLVWHCTQYTKRYRKPNPTLWSFPASPVGPCSVQGL